MRVVTSHPSGCHVASLVASDDGLSALGRPGRGQAVPRRSAGPSDLARRAAGRARRRWRHPREL